MTTLKSVAGTAMELGQEVRKSVVDLGRSAGHKIDEARDQASGALHEAAHSVRHGSGKIENFAKGAARRLDATASFVEDFKLKNMSAAMRRFGRSHPAAVLLTGAAFGFLAGAVLARGKTSA